MRVTILKPTQLRSSKSLKYPRAFTLIELITVIAIISVIMAIILPALSKVRKQARIILGMNNQRQIVSAANFFASENDQRYPESVATIGSDNYWNWSEPMMLTGYRARSPRLHRSMSAYLYNYIQDSDMMFCPNAPRKYTHLKQSWDAADNWDNPETPQKQDPVSGSYCFYWNYTGYIKDRNNLFHGPKDTTGGKRQSKLLVSDYFGYNHWRSRNTYSSCEMFESSSVVEGTTLSSDYWACMQDSKYGLPQVNLHAGYTDGHVERYSSRDTFEMKVILTPRTSTPYPDSIAPGIFYLPRNALH